MTFYGHRIGERSYGGIRQFPCPCRGRSYKVPEAAKDVKLEDIDIIGAIGDSDTAAFAANSRGGLDYFTEYRGVSFATGTDGSWANNPSLANLLRACNPHLEGDKRLCIF